MRNEHIHIDQCNNIMRNLYKQYNGKVIFVDLDKIITGKMNHIFDDLAHMTQEGIRFKGIELGKKILSDLNSDSALDFHSKSNAEFRLNQNK